MDFTESKRQAARDFALALGVPPMLLGIPGDTTHANYQEANRAFWRHTILPLTGRTLKALSGWLGAAYGGGLELRMDLDGVEALSAEREALWARVGAASFLTNDEKRAAVGYGAGARFDESPAVKLFNPAQPRAPSGSSDGGRWTDSGGGSGPSSDTFGADHGSPGVAPVADDTRSYYVVLEDEEKAGLPDPGHTIREHVAQTDDQLKRCSSRTPTSPGGFGAADGQVMPAIPPTPPLFDQMFLALGVQDLDIMIEPGQTLAQYAASFVLPGDARAAVSYLDKLLDGRASATDLRAWLNRRCRDVRYYDARGVEATLREVRSILATGRSTLPKPPVTKRHGR